MLLILQFPEEPFDRRVFQDLSENPILLHAPVAQLDRATDSGSVGRAFESLRVHQYFNGITICVMT